MRNGHVHLGLTRLPPHSMEAEQGLLGCILLDPKVVASVRDQVLDDLFYDLRHQSIYQAMIALVDSGKPIDLISIVDLLTRNRQLEAVGGVPYLSALPDAVPSALNINYYLEILVEHFGLRKLIAACTETVSKAYENEKALDLIESASRAFAELGIKFTGERTSDIKSIVHQCIERFEAYHAGDASVQGLSTGFIDLDHFTNGLKPGDLFVLAGRPSLGKTSLAMNIVEHLALNLGLPVGVFSLEMTAEQLVQRMILSRGRVNLTHIIDRSTSDSEFTRLTGSAGKIAGSKIYIDDTGGLTIAQLRTRARKWKAQHDIKLLVVDYLQLVMSGNTRQEHRDTEIGRISNGIKSLLKELNIPGIILCQMNRDIEKDRNRKPRLSDLRESGSIEQDGDIIAMLYRRESDEDENLGGDAIPVNLLVAKNRTGPTGDVPLTFLKGFTRFESAAKIALADKLA